MTELASHRPPLFSRTALLVVALLACVCVVFLTGWMRDWQWTPTLPLPVVLVTLLVVLSIGEFIRHRFRLSLRALLILMTAATILLGAAGSNAHRARNQKLAVNSVLAYRRPHEDLMEPQSYVSHYRTESVHGQEFVTTEEGWTIPAWLVQLLGKDWFFSVTDAQFDNQDFSETDALLGVDLSPFPAVLFHGCVMGDAAISRLANLDRLNELRLVHCSLNDRHLAVLSKLSRLTSLQLGNVNSNVWGPVPPPNEFTSAGLRQLASLPRLKWLSLSNLCIDSADLEPILALKNLEFLMLDGSLLTNEDVAKFAPLTRLSGLDLSHSQVNEDALPKLRKLKSLEWVCITPSSPEVRDQIARQELHSGSSLRVFVR